MISFTVGCSTSGTGSSIDAVAVLSEVNTVGALFLGFGEGTAMNGTTVASGVLGFSSGSASSGNSGAVWLGTGEAIEGRGRSISPTVGSSTSGAASSIGAIAGGSTVNTVGAMSLDFTGFGEGTATSSGSVLMR